MNFFITEVLVMVAVIVLVDGSSIEYYATKYDHLDVEEALSNRRMVKHYANCLLSRGPCTPQGLELKKILPEALATNCLRCTPRQKAVTYQAIKRLKKEYPKTWVLLAAKWDPNNVYVKKFEESFEQKPSQGGSFENEILIENRFGDTDSENDSPPTTSKAVAKETKATTFRSSSVKPSTTKTFRPSLNSIASASDKKPTTSPPNTQKTQNPLVNVTNQVIQLHNIVSSMISNLINFKMGFINGFIQSG